MEVSHIQFPASKITTHGPWFAFHSTPLPRTNCREPQGRTTERPEQNCRNDVLGFPEEPRTRATEVSPWYGVCSLLNIHVLPRSTERPVRKRRDEPRTISIPTSTAIARGECSDLPVRAAPQNHGRKFVVRG